jgi:Cu(I)/Ag(I) efflux system membrane fusion protein
MAFENRGASWLQADTDIRNPYFGAAMLKCGNIEKLIGPRKKRNGEN